MAALRFSSSHRALNTFRAELRVEQLDPAEEEARLPKLLSLKYSCKNRGGHLTDEHGQIGCALIPAFF